MVSPPIHLPPSPTCPQSRMWGGEKVCDSMQGRGLVWVGHPLWVKALPPHFTSQWLTSPIISFEAPFTLMTPTQVTPPSSWMLLLDAPRGLRLKVPVKDLTVSPTCSSSGCLCPPSFQNVPTPFVCLPSSP